MTGTEIVMLSSLINLILIALILWAYHTNHIKPDRKAGKFDRADIKRELSKADERLDYLGKKVSDGFRDYGKDLENVERRTYSLIESNKAAQKNQWSVWEHLLSNNFHGVTTEPRTMRSCLIKDVITHKVTGDREAVVSYLDEPDVSYLVGQKTSHKVVSNNSEEGKGPLYDLNS